MQSIEQWNIQHFDFSPIFRPLRDAARALPQHGWPDVASINAIAKDCGMRLVNARGERLRFVEQTRKPADIATQFEPSTFLRGEVLLRPHNWHDLFNALVWMTFPRAKAALNARHFAALQLNPHERSPLRDALTHFDEDGVVVTSTDASLLQLLRHHEWKKLFVERRADVHTHLRCYVFGHALYDKARAPFIGFTGKAWLFDAGASLAGESTQEELARIDRMLAAQILNEATLRSPKELSPLPILGVPGWWAANDDPKFYDDTTYFRPARPKSLSAQA
jgi:Protein of unknown function (DUF3025)